MSLKPGDMNCRIAISYVQSGRGPLGEPLPEKQVESGKAWAKRELVSGRKVRTLDQQQVVETCLFTVYPGVLVDIDWKITTKNLVYTVRNIDRKTDRIIITGRLTGGMIELAIKGALERITGMNAYPLLLPDTVQEGATFQRISDPEMVSGMLRTGIVSARIQVNLYRLDDYTSLLQLDKKIWTELKSVVHGQLEGIPVQYVERGGIHQDKNQLTNRRIQYRLTRDFIIDYVEDSS